MDQVKDRKNPQSILEIGCGTGAISLSLLNELPNIRIVAIDQSKLASELTMENAQSHDLQGRLRIFQHKLSNGKLPVEIAKHECFDLIVSNPPYIKTMDLRKLDDEIKM